jgi:hypothetical protein
MAKGFQSLNNNNNVNITPKEDGLIVHARVTDIILDEKHPEFLDSGGWNGIGTIDFSLLENSNQKESSKASPLLPHLKNYPLVNETVLIFALPDRNISKKSNIKSYFYLNPINLWNHPHHNAFPDVYKKEPTDAQNADYKEIEGGQVRRIKDGSSEIDLNSPTAGGTFIEKSNIHPLLAFAGDNIIEGRFGNSFRLGNTSKTKSIYKNNWSLSGENGNPITILRNGQDPNSSEEGWVPVSENINRDLSSIYLTSNQKIPLTNSVENYKAFRKSPILQREFSEPQIILNSGRLVFNTTSNDIILTSKNKIALSAEQTIGISSRKNFIVDSNQIKLGSKFANQPIIRGSDFMDQFEQLLEALKNLTSALEFVQDWPGGAPIPNAVIPPMATATNTIIETILSLVKDEKSPLLSSKSKIE